MTYLRALPVVAFLSLLISITRRSMGVEISFLQGLPDLLLMAQGVVIWRAFR